MRVVFAGTPEFSVPCLRALCANSNINVLAVYTQPDRPAGRGKVLQQSPVKKYAIEKEVPVFQPSSFRQAEELEKLRSLQVDVMLVTAYGMILPQNVLDAPSLGCINVHASLLPRWRGAAPIQRAIEAGDVKTGVTLMQMERGLDTGPMLAKLETDILLEDTGGTLHDRLSELGGDLLSQNIHLVGSQSLAKVAQEEAEACYAHKLSKSESNIDWQMGAQDLERKIRAFNPWPGVTATLNGLKIRVHQAESSAENAAVETGEIVKSDRKGIVVQTGQGQLSFQRVQKPGGKPMTVEAFLNGTTVRPRMQFDQENR